MIFGVYLLPVLACLLLHFGFDYHGNWHGYLLVVIFGEVCSGGIHYFFYHRHTFFTEYLGSIVRSIHFEEEWVELTEYTDTKTDDKGCSHQVKRIRERYHREEYYFFTTLGSRIKCDYRFYSSVKSVWQLPGHYKRWSGREIKGGSRGGISYRFDDFSPSERQNIDKWVPITEAHKYKNKVRSSNSIWKYETIDDKRAAELGLIPYPEITDYDAPCILSIDRIIPGDADRLFRRFNAGIAPAVEMRLYILLYDSGRGIGISELQKAYWQGGNKNEFVICMGLDAIGDVEWAQAFSWADYQHKEKEVCQWLMARRRLDWKALFHYLHHHLSDWKRKEFADFDYIHISLPLPYILGAYGLSIAENALAIYLTFN